MFHTRSQVPRAQRHMHLVCMSRSVHHFAWVPCVPFHSPACATPPSAKIVGESQRGCPRKKANQTGGASWDVSRAIISLLMSPGFEEPGMIRTGGTIYRQSLIFKAYELTWTLFNYVGSPVELTPYYPDHLELAASDIPTVFGLASSNQQVPLISVYHPHFKVRQQASIAQSPLLRNTLRGIYIQVT